MIIFITRHNKTGTSLTEKALRNAGYTDEIKEVYSSDSKAINENALIFNKDDIKINTPNTRNYPTKSVVIFARVFIEEYAKKHKLKNFAIADDDIKSFEFVLKNKKTIKAKNLDLIFLHFVKMLDKNKFIYCISPIPAGRLFGGRIDSWGKWPTQFFFRATNKKLDWLCLFNEDTGMYAFNSKQGRLAITISALRMQVKGVGKQA